MPSFLPKTAGMGHQWPACVDLGELFEDTRFVGSVNRTLDYIYRIYVGYSDGSPERIWRDGVITERFYFKMPTVAALIAEIELMNAISSHALGNIDDENIKVYIKKYLDTHIFVYANRSYEIKAGASPYTGKAVALYQFCWLPLRYGGNCVLNAIQTWLLPALEARSGNNAQFSISKL